MKDFKAGKRSGISDGRQIEADIDRTCVSKGRRDIEGRPRTGRSITRYSHPRELYYTRRFTRRHGWEVQARVVDIDVYVRYALSEPALGGLPLVSSNIHM